MDWQQGASKERSIQFIPAEKGWLALFEESTSEGVKIHADPVIAWCLGAQDIDNGHHIASFGQAVIGASPWLEKADAEQSTHFFALVREYPQFADPEQVSPDEFDPSKLSPIEQRFHRRVAALYTNYFQRNPLFLEDNISVLMGQGGPHADKALMRRQIDFAIGAGFLPPESVPA